MPQRASRPVPAVFRGQSYAGIDLARLERAVQLGAREVGPGVYEVAGSAEPHRVHWDGPEGPECDCADFAFRQTNCKHLLRVALLRGNPRVQRAVGVLVAALCGYVQNLERNAALQHSTFTFIAQY